MQVQLGCENLRMCKQKKFYLYSETERKYVRREEDMSEDKRVILSIMSEREGECVYL